jgi:DNA primase
MLLIEDAFGHETVLDSAEIIAICDHAGMGILAQDLLSAKGLAFSFANPRSDAAEAARDLEVAIETLAARPELDAALAVATERLGALWDEEGFAEQQRLMAARRAADQKLATLIQDDGELG